MQEQSVQSRILKIVAGPALFLLLVLFLPDSAFPFKARVAFGCVLWMGAWWVALPVAPAVTALLPVLLNSLFDLVPMDKVTSCYFSDIVVLLFGACLVSTSWEASGLDKRMAMWTLGFIGPSMARQVIVWFLSSAALSTLLPNAVVCAVMVPIAVSMLKQLGKDPLKGDASAFIVLACIAWGSGIGGLGTPLGGAMNLVAVSYIEKLTGKEFLYLDWVVRLLPVLCLILAVNLLFLLSTKAAKGSLPGSKEFFQKECAALPPMSRDEKLGLLLFMLPTVLSFARGFYADFFPALKPAYLFLVCGMLCFVVPKQDGSPLCTWKEAEEKVEWGLLFLFAGGLAIGGLLNSTGATSACAHLLGACKLDGGIGTILLCVAITVLLAEIASNTAAAAIAVPLVVGIALELGQEPLPYIFICSAAFNVGYMLPTSVRAIPVAYGLAPSWLFRYGFCLTLLNIVVIVLAGDLLLSFCPAFGRI